jgi:Ca2+-binding RTX toxin-like protein
MASRAPAPTPRKPINPIVGIGPNGSNGNNTQSGDWVITDQSYDLTNSPTKHGLSLYGGSALIGYGNNGGTTKLNTLTAASNTGNTSLIAGTASTTMIGGSGDNLLDATHSQGTVSLRGGSGNTTMYAANGPATLVGGGKNNYLVAGTSPARTLGQSLVGGTSTGSNNTIIGGNGDDTLRSGNGFNTLISGSTATASNTLLGGGVSNFLRAASGSDSLAAISGASTLLGGSGAAILLGGTGTNSLASGSTGVGGNTLLGGAGSNTLVAGAGRDSIVGGTKQNLLIVNQANLAAFAIDSISLSTLSSATNTLGVSSTTPITVSDSLFATMAGTGVKNLGTVANLPVQGNAAAKIILGPKAERVGVSTVVAGLGGDTLSVAGYKSSSVLLDASRAVNRASLMGGGSGGDTFLGSKGGYDTMIGASGNDIFVIQPSALSGSSFGMINGVKGIDTLQLGAAASLSGTNFNGVSYVEVLALGSGGSGNNSVGSLQGSGIQKIIGNTGSDTLSANVYGSVRAVTGAGSSTITLNVSPGTSPTMGFAIGQVVTGNGIAIGTTIKGVSTLTGAVTLTLSTPTTSLISQGGAITGWINGATLDGSAALGLPPTNAERNRAVKAFSDKASSITAANYGLPSELQQDVLAINTLKSDPNTYIHRKGDFLVSYGQKDLLIGGQGNGLPDIDLGAGNFIDKSSYSNSPNGVAFYTTDAFFQHQVVDNTLVSGAFSSNTLIGGSGGNLYLINNLPGAAALPTIQNPTSLQSASTIQFTGNGVRLDDAALGSVSAKAAQKIITSNGNNLIQIGQNAAQIGIQTIIGGVGSDTFTTPTDYAPSVFLDASRNGGNSSLVSGSGNDTLLGGSGNTTLLGGDGNNSLVGSNGKNLIKSGVGNSTLDSGYGISTLQADGGTNTFVIRNRWTRILNPDPSNPQTGTIPEVGIVSTYVNFDPIQGDPVSQFAPDTPDNSPSVTKSPSFASSDLSSFYNLQHFNLLGGANYGVGNALDNSIIAASANALLLGMGGNNTLVANGTNSSLYGDSNAQYASPDLYAYAPIDTRDQAFVDGVMGVAGNNSLVANGANSYLDAGIGYDDGLFDGSGSNTLIGNASNDTIKISHQADFVSLKGNSNTVVTSVDLYQAPNNVSDLILNITPQLANSGQVTLAGQRMTAGYAAVSGATGGYTDTNSIHGGNAPAIVVNNSAKIQVTYGSSDGTVYGSKDVPDANLPLGVGSFVPDPKNPGKQSVTLTWATPVDPSGYAMGQTMGYVVNYQLVATNKNGKILSQTPYLTYLKGTSQDLNGTWKNPRLTVDNLSQGFTDPYTGHTYDSSNSTISYNFRVTAQEKVLPAYTDASGNLIAKTVSLLGGQGNDVLYGDLLDNYGAGFSNTRPVLSNNPLNDALNPLDPGTIPTPAPWSVQSNYYGLFPVYLGGGLGGNDLLIAPVVNDGSGRDFTAYEYIEGAPTPVTFSGLCTLEGGQGSDTFVVSNGGGNIYTTNGVVNTDPFDHIVKYGKENPSNLVFSQVQYLSLSDTVVDQGKFVNKVWAPYADQYLGGNRLDNTLVGYGLGDTLLGGGGRDYLDATQGNGGAGTLIGGTAYGLDNIALALANYAAGQSSSIYRDTDPVPVQPNGAGAADNSQYWIVNGHYDPLRNSDTLLAGSNISGLTHGEVLDGGAGNDSMVGGTGNDTLYVSSGYVFSNNANINDGDVVVGGSGNDWIVYTGSDVYWSGGSGSTTLKLGYKLNPKGDAEGGLSISNIQLQAGDPIARFATGNATSTGNDTLAGGAGEIGSNILIGNEYGATLDGGGVGTGATGGIDSLVGNATGVNSYGVRGTADLFVIQDSSRPKQYTESAGDKAPNLALTGPTAAKPYFSYNVVSHATDLDYAVINATRSTIDSLSGGNGAHIKLTGSASDYLIGSAPTGFKNGNIQGSIPSSPNSAASSTDFGIYKLINGAPNLITEVKGIQLGMGLTPYSIGGFTVDGQNNPLNGTHMGGNQGIYSPGDVAIAQKFAGMGAFYNLAGSSFHTDHVIIA